MDISIPTTPSHSRHTSNAHRLLYRGALSLPDSYLLLDGLSFTTDITDSHVTSTPSKRLLENPLALALESMRGRPNLHFLGTEKLSDVWLDTSRDVHVYVHDSSILTKIYFENVLSLAPITSKDGRTAQGIRVGLSDSSDHETIDFLIYGQLRPDHLQDHLPSTSSNAPMSLHILAARILPNPPPPLVRPPRPDDPTPRKPPAHLATSSAKRKRDLSGVKVDLGSNAKRAKSKTEMEEDEQVRLAREVMLNMPKPGASKFGASLPKVLGKDVRTGKADNVFKVPEVPLWSQSQLDAVETDVFGDVSATMDPKGKGRTTEKPGSDELEKANKIVIKQAAVSCLIRHGVRKGQAEFNEIYQSIYRGVQFALRNITRTQAVNPRTVDRLLEAHAKMYVNGNGENHPITPTQDSRK
ncbi:unnamed protein product [Somion occarium]|uniref:Sld7 C-terminal domain-containing protein n=1 Tax=Somion occarium TaxID=3059160 RepID=A0ABP1DZJ7_9APHY